MSALKRPRITCGFLTAAIVYLLATTVAPTPAHARSVPSLPSQETVTAREKDSYAGARARVISVSKTRVRLEVFPGTPAAGWGGMALNQTGTFTAAPGAAVTVNGRSTTLRSLRPGTFVTVDGYVTEKSCSWTCSDVPKFNLYFGQITAIGTCTVSRSVRIAVPLHRDKTTRMTTCVTTGTGNRVLFARLTPNSNLGPATVVYSFEGGATITLDLLDGNLASRGLDASMLTSTGAVANMKAELTYDVTEDGREPYVAQLGRQRL